MSAHRRHFLASAAALTGLGAGSLMLGASPSRSQAAEEAYKALVVVFLTGGNDGHNTLVPTDGMYSDYQSARANLALLKSSLTNLPGTAAGHTFGLHPGLSPLAPLYTQQRLAFVANVGPLVVPATAAQVRANAVAVPPFLLSHSDQVAMQQGWTGNDDLSGWGGRSLELLPSTLRHGLSAVTADNDRTLVLGKSTPVSFFGGDGPRYWGWADLAHPERANVQALSRMARWQSNNAYEQEYARTFGLALADSTVFTQAIMQSKVPAGDFGTDGNGNLGEKLRRIATVLPFFKAQGYRRQIFLVNWGQLDTHANQRGGGSTTQDTQMSHLAKALAAFDSANRASGLDMNVVTAVMSDFGRTVRPGSGGGSEHAWGNHLFAIGGPVAGGTVLGTFPSPVLGGPDDGDYMNNGRHVPSTSTDQFAASLMLWMGLEPARLDEAFPNLVNFRQKSIPLLRA
jgi:uncharacterized protein (DUF1501 family)